MGLEPYIWTSSDPQALAFLCTAREVTTTVEGNSKIHSWVQMRLFRWGCVLCLIVFVYFEDQKLSYRYFVRQWILGLYLFTEHIFASVWRNGLAQKLEKLFCYMGSTEKFPLCTDSTEYCHSYCRQVSAREPVLYYSSRTHCTTTTLISLLMQSSW